MLFIRFKCPQCDAEFKKLNLFIRPDSLRRCSECGAEHVPVIKTDADKLRIEEKIRCSKFG